MTPKCRTSWFFFFVIQTKIYVGGPVGKRLSCAARCWLLNVFSLVSFLQSWRVSEYLTSGDLCPSWFKLLISTARMTAPANCTPVCLLTRRLALPLSKVRSASDYNPFPSSLWFSFATSWQQLFQLISHEVATSQRRPGRLCTDPASISSALFDWVF